ncbi:alpha-ketoglutarate-dependent dioxygenase AlkB [Prosthecobacter sp. SYSU 5D2]|uniref:alpha-ketoglutarate-dependent dioxygenase AlkB family protein n=1 Tax=Prosthecobacter sp. SYSU 5D2 TaxID=3134134 RepID=UPI0031FE5F78
MDLFTPDPGQNLLPCDGIVNYHGPVFSPEEAQELNAALMQNIMWQNDEVVLFGKRIITSRKVAWHADNGLTYSYSGSIKQAHPWTPALIQIKDTIQQISGAVYNACLLNLYHDGSEGMGWHSDDEKSIVPASAIASVSFGAERKFSFKHKRKPEALSLLLEDGSLLVMKGSTQTHWLHSLPKSKKVTQPRINLTFRSML